MGRQAATIVTTATLRLYDFGLPVHIAVPHPLERAGAVGVAIAGATSCPAGTASSSDDRG